jgi:hypothetical protein
MSAAAQSVPTRERLLLSEAEPLAMERDKVDYLWTFFMNACISGMPPWKTR